jgi:hypothetical protein
MADTPFEISVTLNATSQMLAAMGDSYGSTAAVAPSAQLENIRGYDVEMPFLKAVFLQYKRPYLLGYASEPFSFHTDHEDQLATLQTWACYFPRSTFYALPLVPRDAQLDETLGRTLFVDVLALREETTRIRVTPASSGTATAPVTVSEVKAKVRNGEWYPLHEADGDWTRWDTFERGLRSPAGGERDADVTDDDWEPAGLVLTDDGEPASYPKGAQYDDRSRQSTEPVRDRMEWVCREFSIEFWEQGLEAGMFGR